MAVHFTTFEEYFTDFHPHLMIYGYNGTGKTTLAGRTGLRTVLLDCGDAGVMTLRKMDRSKLKIVKIRSTSHYMDVMEMINRKSSSIDLLIPDTLTGLQSMAVREAKNKGEMNQRKWGQVTSKMIECIAETRIFPHDVIYLAQEKRKSKGDGDTAFMNISPSLTPSVREYLSSCVDWIGRLYVEDEKRKLSFILSEDIEAKDRADLFPKVIQIGKPELAYGQIRKRIVEGL